MQMAESQTGISVAMLRFSHLVGRRGPGAVDGEGAHRQEIALVGHHHGGHALDELGRVARDHGRAAARRRGQGRHLDFVEVRERVVDGGEVLLDHFLALPAVGLLDRTLDLFDGLVAREHAARWRRSMSA